MGKENFATVGRAIDLDHHEGSGLSSHTEVREAWLWHFEGPAAVSLGVLRLSLN